MTAFSERPDPMATDSVLAEADAFTLAEPAGPAARTDRPSRPPPPVNSTWKIVRRSAG